MNLLSYRTWWGSALVLGVAAGLLAACDATPGPAPLDRQLPVVDALAVSPDTVRVADLPDDAVSDGQALVDLDVAVTARDGDGTVDRVLVALDPAYGASAAGVARLDPVDGNRYGGRLRYPLALDAADVITVRAFAVDDDSLTSNQVATQIHVIPAEPDAAGS